MLQFSYNKLIIITTRVLDLRNQVTRYFVKAEQRSRVRVLQRL